MGLDWSQLAMFQLLEANKEQKGAENMFWCAPISQAGFHSRPPQQTQIRSGERREEHVVVLVQSMWLLGQFKGH